MLGFSGLMLAGSIFALTHGGALSNFNPPTLEFARAIKLMQDDLASQRGHGGSSFELIFSSDSLLVSDPEFQQAQLSALEPVRGDQRVTKVTTPYDPPTDGATTAPGSTPLVSKDGHRALVLVTLKDEFNAARAYYPELRSMVHSDRLKIFATGQVAVNSEFDRYLQADLQRAEFVSLPLVAILLFLVFATAVAMFLPLGVGGLAVVGGLAAVGLLARVTDVSTYATNIVTLIGLGVAIDYSLFIVNRFREELARGKSTEESLAATMATSGRAVVFSGLTVAIGLSGMLFFQGSFLASMGLAGAVVVAVAVLYALTFLAALLALLGNRVNWGTLFFHPEKQSQHGLWHAVANWVMARPLLVLLPVLAILGLVASPFLQLRLANGDVNMLPPTSETRRGTEMLTEQFPGRNLNYISVVVDYPGSPLSRERIGDLYGLSRRLQQLPGVTRVESIVNLDDTLGRSDYQSLLTGPTDSLPAKLQQAVKTSVGSHIVVLAVVTSQPPESDPARGLVRAIRQESVPGAHLLVTGQTAYDIDFIDFTLQRVPGALIFVMVATYVVLFLLVGSILLPLKAVVMNVISISASFGALVWIFQQGHLSSFLNFSAASLDPSVPVLLFCIVFGLSMDYEVLLVSRIQEEYRRSGNTTQAVAEGLQRSGRLITGAAAIMVGVFLSFGLADVVLIKAIGLGLAIAVAVDATLVRALIVPAVMRLLGDWNWWSPQPLARLHRRLRLAEAPAS